MDENTEESTHLSDKGETHDVVSAEYDGRAMMKFARATELFQSLEQSVGRWNEEHKLMAPARIAHNDDRRVEFFRPSEMNKELPWTSWDSLFHDGVHNLRVALDAFCFDLCQLEQVPSNPGNIYFPITAHPNEWPNKSENLHTMPASLLARVRQCQPWERPDQQNPDPLTLISRIDNVDKHRASGVALEVMPLMQLEQRPTAPLPHELADSANWPLEPWMAMTLAEPIGQVEAVLMPVMAVPIVTFEGLAANLLDAQRWMHHEVWRVISFIASGDWLAAGFDRVLPEPTWWPLPANLGH